MECWDQVVEGGPWRSIAACSWFSCCMAETVVLVECNSTRISVDKAGTAKLDMAEEGLRASLAEAWFHLRCHEMLSDVLFAEAYGRQDILVEVELQELLTALVGFAGAFSIC